MIGIGFSATLGIGGAVVARSLVAEHAARILINAINKYVFNVLITNGFK